MKYPGAGKVAALRLADLTAITDNAVEGRDVDGALAAAAVVRGVEGGHVALALVGQDQLEKEGRGRGLDGRHVQRRGVENGKEGATWQRVSIAVCRRCAHEGACLSPGVGASPVKCVQLGALGQAKVGEIQRNALRRREQPPAFALAGRKVARGVRVSG